MEGTLNAGPQPKRSGTSSRHKATAADRAASIVSSRDSNGDGLLSYEEFNRGFTGAAAQEKLARFTEADANSDNLMSVEEFTVVLEKLSRKAKPDTK